MLRHISIRRAFIAKEILQHRGAFILENPGSDLALVIQSRVLEQIYDAAGAAAARVGAAENHATNADVDERAGAHHAWLFGDVKIAINQTPIAHGCLGLGQGQHLGVRGCVFQQFNLIISAPDNLSRPHNYCADRHFVGFISFPGQAQRLAYEILVAYRINHRSSL
jgi:hypothetical protein